MNTSTVIRVLGRYILAVLVSYTLASLFSTQSVVASLGSLGVTVTWPERMRMGLQDLAGMRGVFLPVIAAAFALALPVASWLGRRRPTWRKHLFALAGAVGLIAVHLSLKAAFDIIPIAGARSALGLAAQALAGAVGGYMFTVFGRSAG
ncbi:MAG TPA: hypothetical protein VI566_06330 [Xanthomonadales bacterium]|nr:hypothetical protein [Xanthomonadales bacterium]